MTDPINLPEDADFEQEPTTTPGGMPLLPEDEDDFVGKETAIEVPPEPAADPLVEEPLYAEDSSPDSLDLAPLDEEPELSAEESSTLSTVIMPPLDEAAAAAETVVPRDDGALSNVVREQIESIARPFDPEVNIEKLSIFKKSELVAVIKEMLEHEGLNADPNMVYDLTELRSKASYMAEQLQSAQTSHLAMEQEVASQNASLQEAQQREERQGQLLRQAADEIERLRNSFEVSEKALAEALARAEASEEAAARLPHHEAAALELEDLLEARGSDFEKRERELEGRIHELEARIEASEKLSADQKAERIEELMRTVSKLEERIARLRAELRYAGLVDEPDPETNRKRAMVVVDRLSTQESAAAAALRDRADLLARRAEADTGAWPTLVEAMNEKKATIEVTVGLGRLAALSRDDARELDQLESAASGI